MAPFSASPPLFAYSNRGTLEVELCCHHPLSYLNHVPVRKVKPRSVAGHKVVITRAKYSVPVRMRGGEFHACAIDLGSSTTL